MRSVFRSRSCVNSIALEFKRRCSLNKASTSRLFKRLWYQASSLVTKRSLWVLRWSRRWRGVRVTRICRTLLGALGVRPQKSERPAATLLTMGRAIRCSALTADLSGVFDARGASTARVLAFRADSSTTFAAPRFVTLSGAKYRALSRWRWSATRPNRSIGATTS